MMEFAAILKGSQVMAEFLGLDSVSAFWYLCLWFGSFTWLFKRQGNIMTKHAELTSQYGSLIEKIKALHMRQDMQKDYVKEWELRYKDQQKDNSRYGRALVDSAIDSAVVKQLLQSNNIKAKC